MHILILGHAADAHAAHVKGALEQAGAIVNYWDTQQFPTQSQISWSPTLQTGHLVLPGQPPLAFATIHSVFWRNFSGVAVPVLTNADQHQIAINDAMSAMRSFVQACPAYWVNSWDAYQFHKEKPLQLAKAKQLGVQIPATLITNDPAQVVQFVDCYEKAIFKPVYGGAHTALITRAHLEPKRLQTVLRLAPVTVQEYIPGTNIRSYIVGKSIYAAEIRSIALDFRSDRQAELIPLELPEAIQQQCLEIAKAFSLEWTAIDWRMTPAGNYVFLEANPSPMFLHFERQTHFPITKRLVELLTAS
ncbi:MAG: ATP-grasp ribosomal peptide maturase [Elainellaceae cyanobacterium]